MDDEYQPRRRVTICLLILLIGLIAFLIWGGVSGLFGGGSISTPASFVNSFDLTFTPSCWAAIPATTAIYLCNPNTNTLDLWRFNGHTWTAAGYSIASPNQCTPSVLFTNGSVMFSGLHCGTTNQGVNLTAYVLNSDLTVRTTITTNVTTNNTFWAGVSNGLGSVVSLCQIGGPCELDSEISPSTFQTIPSSTVSSSPTAPFTSLSMNNQWLFALGNPTSSSTKVQQWLNTNDTSFAQNGSAVLFSQSYNYILVTAQGIFYIGGPSGFFSTPAIGGTQSTTTAISTTCKFLLDPLLGTTMYFVDQSVVMATTSAPDFTPLWRVSISGAAFLTTAHLCELLLLDDQYLVLLSTDRRTVHTWAL